jgi:hypothetical protein
MKPLLLLQLLLPLLLIGWTALAPAESKLGCLSQTVGTAAALLGLALTGLWLFPTWWTPYVFAALLVAVATQLWWRRRTLVSSLPSGWAAWIITVMFFGFGVWGTDQSARALAGHAQQGGTASEPFQASLYPCALKVGFWFAMTGSWFLDFQHGDKHAGRSSQSNKTQACI